jgi:hypothetical protein
MRTTINLLDKALADLRSEATADSRRRWRPGQQPTNAELLWNHITKIQDELSLAKDALFLYEMK